MFLFSRLLSGVLGGFFLVSFFLFLSLEASGFSHGERAEAARNGHELMEQKKPEEAIVFLERAVLPGAKKRDLIRCFPALGRCHESLKNYHKALSCYRQAYDLRPKDTERALDLARLYALVNLDAQAIEVYEKALKRAPSRQDIFYTLGALYFRQGRLREARYQTEKALHWEPRDIAAQRLMAQIEESSGDLAAAAHTWQGVLGQEPTFEGHVHLADLWARVGEYALAEDSFRKAEESLFLPQEGGMFDLRRGVVAWQSGDKVRAKALWSQALEKTPNLIAGDFFLALVSQDTQRMDRIKAQTDSDYMRDLVQEFLSQGR
jgi:tetratricopeptide (TPR) repeat protein